MDHSVKRRRQAFHQTHYHYYLNISVEAANLSDWQIESNRIETFFCPNWNALPCCPALLNCISVPIQLAQCWFPGLAISNATYFSNIIYGSNFIKQHSENAMVWNCQNADCSLQKNKVICVICYNFRHTLVLHWRRCADGCSIGQMKWRWRASASRFDWLQSN